MGEGQLWVQILDKLLLDGEENSYGMGGGELESSWKEELQRFPRGSFAYEKIAFAFTVPVSSKSCIKFFFVVLSQLSPKIIGPSLLESGRRFWLFFFL